MNTLLRTNKQGHYQYILPCTEDNILRKVINQIDPNLWHQVVCEHGKAFLLPYASQTLEQALICEAAIWQRLLCVCVCERERREMKSR